MTEDTLTNVAVAAVATSSATSVVPPGRPVSVLTSTRIASSSGPKSLPTAKLTRVDGRMLPPWSETYASSMSVTINACAGWRVRTSVRVVVTP